MNRRRFVVTAISAAAVGTALATDACSPTGGAGRLIGGFAGNEALSPQAQEYTLTCKYALTEIKGYKLRTRTYDGATVGPTLQTEPGTTMIVKVINDFPPNPKAVAPAGIVRIPDVRDEMEAMDPMFRGRTRPSAAINATDNPHDFNTTNLHVHGIQTIPHIFYPLGTSDPKAMMLMIDPGKSYRYIFPIPQDHPSGLHWYHPHKHGSTDVQVSGGMAGLIVVKGPIDQVPEIAAAREFFVVVQTLDVNPSKTEPGVYEREYLAYKTPQEGGYAFSTMYTMMTTNGEGICWIDRTKIASGTYTQLSVPSLRVAPGEVVRLRVLNGTNYFTLMMALPGFEAWQIGFDGINTLDSRKKDMSGTGVTEITPANLFNAPVRFAMAGNRIEFLIRAPQQAGTYTLSSLASRGVDSSPRAKVDLAQFVVAGAPVTMGIPKALPKPTREYPVITAADVVKNRRFTFGSGPQPTLLTGFGFTVDNELYDESVCPTQPRVGTCEEWRIENETGSAHPFHLHENSFQLIAVNDVPNVPMEVWDTFMLPPKVNGVNGSITIRVRFVQWTGKTVFHCHILPHEDTGMMQNILMR